MPQVTSQLPVRWSPQAKFQFVAVMFADENYNTGLIPLSLKVAAAHVAHLGLFSCF